MVFGQARQEELVPTAERRQHHAAQVHEYLSTTGTSRGIVVYMTTGEVQEVSARGQILISRMKTPGLIHCGRDRISGRPSESLT
jgi:hypothetical protein